MASLEPVPLELNCFWKNESVCENEDATIVSVGK
jgi:hypothetical protein